MSRTHLDPDSRPWGAGYAVGQRHPHDMTTLADASERRSNAVCAGCGRGLIGLRCAVVFEGGKPYCSPCRENRPAS